MQLLDGKQTSAEIKDEIAKEVEQIVENGGKVPHLAAVLIGDDGASHTYVNAKIKACERVGFKSSLVQRDSSISEDELLQIVHDLNTDDDIDGFIVQSPLPDHISELKITEAIDPKKDVDGFHPTSVGKMALNLPTYLPATPYGIIELLKRYNIETSGKHCVVVGRSHIVGSPVSILMARNSNPGNATVTLTHSRTKNLTEITKSADILIVALGKDRFIKGDMVKEDAVIIDVGITRLPSDKTKSGWKLWGDVDFDSVSPKASYITPVPGGVGPMTIAMLLTNTMSAAKNEFYN